jgi:hypothetical protein
MLQYYFITASCPKYTSGRKSNHLYIKPPFHSTRSLSGRWDNLSTAHEYIHSATTHRTALNYLITGPAALLSTPHGAILSNNSTRPTTPLPEPPTTTAPPAIAAPPAASAEDEDCEEDDEMRKPKTELPGEPPWLALGAIGTVRDGEVGCMIHPTASGRGIATEALRAFGGAFFARFLREPEVRAIASARNPSSMRVLEKAGFSKLPGVGVDGDEEHDDVAVWSLDAATGFAECSGWGASGALGERTSEAEGCDDVLARNVAGRARSAGVGEADVGHVDALARDVRRTLQIQECAGRQPASDVGEVDVLDLEL